VFAVSVGGCFWQEYNATSANCSTPYFDWKRRGGRDSVQQRRVSGSATELDVERVTDNHQGSYFCYTAPTDDDRPPQATDAITVFVTSQSSRID